MRINDECWQVLYTARYQRLAQKNRQGAPERALKSGKGNIDFFFFLVSVWRLLLTWDETCTRVHALSSCPECLPVCGRAADTKRAIPMNRRGRDWCTVTLTKLKSQSLKEEV